MTGPQAIRTLLVEDEAGLIDDYRCILCPPEETGSNQLFSKLESDLFGSAVVK